MILDVIRKRTMLTVPHQRWLLTTFITHNVPCRATLKTTEYSDSLSVSRNSTSAISTSDSFIFAD